MPSVLNAMTAVFTVTTAADSGAGSLREAVRLANATGGPARVDFAIDAGATTIRLASPLPPIAFAGLVDGWTQPGPTGRPLVEISGADAYAGIGLEIVGGGLTVRGVAVTDWPDDGIFVHDCADVVLVGIHAGVRLDGATSAGNGGAGIHLARAVPCRVGGPGDDAVVASGNSGFGILVNDSADRSQVEGSFVGTDRDGRRARPNLLSGIKVEDAAGVVLGGSTDGSRNVISGNLGYGVEIVGPQARDAIVVGNHVGTDAAGGTAIPNGACGIVVYNAPNARIGGPSAREGNVLSGNGSAGVMIAGARATGAAVVANRLGTDAAGCTAIPNGRSGVVVHGAPGARIGGPSPAEGNVISGNVHYGMEIAGPEARGAVVIGNHVGTDAAGLAAVPNHRSGILVYNAPGVRIGSSAPGEGNVISGGARAGVNLDGSVLAGSDFTGKGHARGNVVQGNLIGVDKTGERPLGNQLRGVLINHAQDNLIVDNVISANGEDGILILGPDDDSDPNLTPSGNLVLRNLIGVTLSGEPCGNGRFGVLVRNGKHNEIGGGAGDANSISWNGDRGVTFSGLGARTNALSPFDTVTSNKRGDFHQPRE